MNNYSLPTLNNTWGKLLQTEITKPYYQTLQNFLAADSQKHTIYPPVNEVFAALNYTDYPQVKVVILGQDPYHNENQAEGLAFSVKNGCQLPPSLKNIFKELHKDTNCPIPNKGSLIPWAKQGVLLLNTVLTVEAHRANSHSKKGWEIFTNEIIKLLNQHPHPLVFMLWGNSAKQKKALLTNPNHLILEAPHPSPLSAYQGFFGCGHFSKANEFLQNQQLAPITWELT